MLIPVVTGKRKDREECLHRGYYISVYLVQMEPFRYTIADYSIEEEQMTPSGHPAYTLYTCTRSVPIGSEHVEVTVMIEDPESTPASREAFLAGMMNNHLNWIRENEAAIRTHLATRMLELANDWRGDEDDPEFTVPLLEKRFSLYGMNVFDSGDFTLYFNDDDVFAGHDVGLDVSAAYEMDDDPSI